MSDQETRDDDWQWLVPGAQVKLYFPLRCFQSEWFMVDAVNSAGIFGCMPARKTQKIFYPWSSFVRVEKATEE